MIDALRAKHDPHYKLSGKVEGLEKGVSDQVSQIHKTISKSFVTQRKTLARVLGLEKRVNHLEIQEAAEEQAKENLDDILSDIYEDEAEVGGTKTKAKPKTKKKPKAKKSKISASAFKKGTSQESLEERVERIAQNKVDEAAAEQHKQTSEYQETTTGVDSETGEALSPEERKRRFKLKKGTISTSKFFDKDESKDLPEGEKGGAIVKIGNSVTSIVETLKEDQKQDKKQQGWFRKMVERVKRRKKENKLEFKVLDGIKKTATKLLEPMKGAWNSFLDFIGKIILGRVLFKILEWMGNKENQGKLKSIIKFFQDWWPTMLAAYLLFGNTFTSFVAKMLGRLVVWGVKLAATVIPKLIGALTTMGPKGIKLLAKAGSGALLFSGGGEVETESYPSFESEIGVQMAGGGLVPNFNEGDVSVNNFTTNYYGGGLVQNYSNFNTNYNGGGLVKHFNEGGLVNTTENIVGEVTENINSVTGGVAAVGSDGVAGSDGVVGSDGVAGIDGIGSDGVAGSDAVAGIDGAVMEQQDPMVKKDPLQLNNQILDAITQFIATLPFKDQIEMVSPDQPAPQEFKQGGFVSGPGGVDKVPARLTAGEFVMSKGAVQKYGANTLAAMNSAGGGTNRPTVSRYNGGGLVKNYKGGGLVKGESYNPITGGSDYWHPDDGVIRGFRSLKNFSYRTNKEKTQANITSNKTATVITPSEKKKVTVAYQEEKQNMADKPNTEKSSSEIPNFSVTAMRSSQKIKILGISV